MFRTVPLSVIRRFSLYTQQWCMSYRFAESLTASRIRMNLQFRPDPAHCQAVNKPVWHIPLPCLQWKTPDDRQRNCPKHVELYSKYIHILSAYSWFYYKNLSLYTVTWTSNLIVYYKLRRKLGGYLYSWLKRAWDYM